MRGRSGRAPQGQAVRRSACALAALALLGGCDLLFPEFSGHVDAGADDGGGLPVASAHALQQAAALDGFSLDPTRGALLAWTVDSMGKPVAGASAQAAAGVGVGPLYEGGGPDELDFGSATGARG